MNPQNLVSEICTFTGFAGINLQGAHPGARSFGAAYADADTLIPVKLEELNPMGAVIAWEFVLCTFHASLNALTRDAVQLSSNGNNAVNFGAGSKRCFVFLPVEAADVATHINATEPHPAYDDMPSTTLIFENGLV